MAPFPVLTYLAPDGISQQCRLIAEADLHNVLACDSMLVNSNIAKDRIIARLRQLFIDREVPDPTGELDESSNEPDFYALQGFEGCDVGQSTTVVVHTPLLEHTSANLESQKSVDSSQMQGPGGSNQSTPCPAKITSKILPSRSAASLHALTQNTCLGTPFICSMRESINRPQYTLAQLCAMAILLSSPETPSSGSIIDWIASTFRYYRTPTVQDWKKCIRNILYTNKERFERNSMQKDQFVVREESKAEFVQVVEEMRAALEESSQQDENDEIMGDEESDEMIIS